MKVMGYAASKAGGRLEPIEFELEKPGPQEVEIAVTHCGICHSDIHMIDDDWGITAYPLVPGHEIVGTVRSMGPEAKGFFPGQRVGVGWQSGSCLRCEWCLRGEENCCPEQRGTCVKRHGGYAEAIRVHGRFVFPIPEGLESRTAAPLLCGGITVYTPLKELARPGSRVGVIGIGGLGHFALQFARAFGCEVTAFSTTPAKEGEARELGAHRFIVSTDKAQMRKALDSVDLLVSSVTAKMEWETWMRTLRPRGTLVLVGASPGTLSVSPMTLIAGKQSIRGSSIGNCGDIREMLDFAARNKVQARVEALPMAKVNEAIEKVRKNQARYRMVLEN